MSWVFDLVDRWRADMVRQYLRSFHILAEETGFRILSLRQERGSYVLRLHARSEESIANSNGVLSVENVLYRSVSFTGPGGSTLSLPGYETDYEDYSFPTIGSVLTETTEVRGDERSQLGSASSIRAASEAEAPPSVFLVSPQLGRRCKPETVQVELHPIPEDAGHHGDEREVLEIRETLV